MSRALAMGPDVVRRVKLDPRFRAAANGPMPEADWRARGECLTHDPELFFPNAAEDKAGAISICRRCPVQAPCLAAGDCDGVWGGTTESERRAMRRVWALAR